MQTISLPCLVQQVTDLAFRSTEKRNESYLFGILRWRGSWNWKDITERMIAGFLSGLGIGLGVGIVLRMLGGL
jgi:hypothetical protein